MFISVFIVFAERRHFDCIHFAQNFLIFFIACTCLMCQYGFGKHIKNLLKDFLDQIANVCSTSLRISVALKYLYSIIVKLMIGLSFNVTDLVCLELPYLVK